MEERSLRIPRRPSCLPQTPAFHGTAWEGLREAVKGELRGFEQRVDVMVEATIGQKVRTLDLNPQPPEMKWALCAG